MGNSLPLGKIKGIEIGIHYTWLIVMALITWSLAVGFFPVLFPTWSIATYWIVSAIAALLLFASVLVHELCHSLVALSIGMKVRSITLFIFGGVSNIEGEPTKAGQEFTMAIAGPLASVVLGVVFGFLWLVFRRVNAPIGALFFYLASINILLAIFNMIPGFPLDGGRVFRSIVWSITNNFLQATRVATLVGRAVAYLMIFTGLFLIFSGAILSGIWIGVIGWFLANAAEQSYRQTVLEHRLHGIRVQQMMNPNPITVDPNLTVRQVIMDYILRLNVGALPVVENGELLGMLTLGDLKHVPHEDWDQTTVAQVMNKRDHLKTVTPSDDLTTVLRDLGEEDVSQLPVVEGDRFVGIISRNYLLSYLQVRRELGVNP